MYLNFGKPMHFSPAASETEVTEQVETVKAELRRLIQVGLEERTSLY